MNKIIRLISTALISITPSFASASNKTPAPDTLNAFIGGVLGKSYWVSLENHAVVYSTSPSSSVTPEKKVIFHPTDEEWSKFKTMLNDAKVWNWKERYENMNVTDGTNWKLEVKWGRKSLKSSGYNAYPDKENFDRYLKAIQMLIKGNEFQ